MSQYNGRERALLRQVAKDARLRALADVKGDLRAEYLKVSAFSRIPGILRRGILSGLSTAIKITEERMGRDGADESASDRGNRPGTGADG